MAILGILGAGGTVGCGLMNILAKQTMRQFVDYAKNGDSANCRAMLAEGHPGYRELGADNFRRAFDRQPTAEPISLMDFLRGRQHFRVNRKWVDGYITVERGRVTMDEDFIRREVEWPKTPFRLTKQVEAMEEYNRRLAGDHNPEEEP
ncbi:MAG: hypothetical protein JSS02_33690 [Planctomycetes bacterium]|nr:hypothetical protein [Planctomycetota bacterium]